MNRSLVIGEWRRAAEALGAAQSCRRDGFYADAVSRAYYAILHAAKAALQLQDKAITNFKATLSPADSDGCSGQPSTRA